MKHRILIPVAILAALTSCSINEDTVDGPVDKTLYDIVTFDGNVDGHARFSFQQVNDSPLINLVAQGELQSDDLKEGARLYIIYIPESGLPYTSGNITLRGAAFINSGQVVEQEMNDDMSLWNRDKVYVYSLWRSGNYINLHCRLTYSSEPRTFRLTVDPATIGNDYPDLYIHHEMASPTDNHDRGYYASWDMSPVWVLPSTLGVTIHVANSNLPQTTFTFSK